MDFELGRADYQDGVVRRDRLEHGLEGCVCSVGERHLPRVNVGDEDDGRLVALHFHKEADDDLFDGLCRVSAAACP